MHFNVENKSNISALLKDYSQLCLLNELSSSLTGKPECFSESVLAARHDDDDDDAYMFPHEMYQNIVAEECFKCHGKMVIAEFKKSKIKKI